MIEKNNKEEIDEISAMSAGSVQGASSTGSRKVTKNLPKEYYTSRTQFIEEMNLREIVREGIREVKKNNTKRREEDEKELRKILKTLIQEAKKDIQDTPHSSTAINILEDLLKQILPNLETEYKTLTTSKEQRDSFRAHVVNAVSTLLETEDINKEGGSRAEEETLISLDEQDEDIEEEVEIKVSDVDASVGDKFIDIDPPPTEEPEEDTFGIEGQDATGRALSQEAFNNIEKNISETYAILHDEVDEKLFKDYLVTNLKLYFDKWEKELGAVTEPTTDEYEAEKDQGDAGPEAGTEFDTELGGDLSATGTGEELV